MPGYSTECQPIANKITGLKSEVASFQKELQTAAPGEKAGLIHQIQVIRQQYMTGPLAHQIAAKEDEYHACVKAHGGLSAMDAHFKGHATMFTTNSHAPGPFKQDVDITLHFGDWDHSSVTVTHFPPISVTYDTHSIAGTVTTTVTMNSGTGYYNPQDHSISITLNLFFHHNTSLAGDSTLHITLSSSGPIAADGSVDAFGGGTFKGGFLGDDECSIDVKGKIDPRP